MARLARQFGVLILYASGIGAQSAPKFMGREVTIITPELDEDGFSPKGPATICVEGAPRQCYTAPKDYGRDPTVMLVQVDKDLPALLFSAESGGVSGWGIHLALLHPETGTDLKDLFASDMTLSNQSRHAFWVDLSISDAEIFVTADYVWGPDEAHYSPHRYTISAYVRRSSSLLDERYYFLEDQYMTVRTYASEPKVDILGSEKKEILARLKRIKREASH